MVASLWPTLRLYSHIPGQDVLLKPRPEKMAALRWSDWCAEDMKWKLTVQAAKNSTTRKNMTLWAKVRARKPSIWIFVQDQQVVAVARRQGSPSTPKKKLRP